MDDPKTVQSVFYFFEKNIIFLLTIVYDIQYNGGEVRK